jgi:TolB protein
MKIPYAIALILALLVTLLGGCNSATNNPSTQVALTVSPSLSTTSTLTHSYQLAYKSSENKDYDGVYAVDIGCLENENPCISAPKSLFEIPYGETPGAPIDYPRWSPDGRYVALCAVGNAGRADIFVAEVDIWNWINVTNSPIHECESVWSSDGQRLVYVASSYELYQGSRVFSNSPLGGDKTQLLRSANKSVEEISLSQDGEKMAFTSRDDNGFSQIFISDLDGSDIVQITSELSDHFTPAFSPDGDRIVFEREVNTENPNSQIIVMKLDDKSEIEIGKNLSGTKTWLSWAPFGDWIAFASNAEGTYDIFIIKDDGSKLTKVTSENSDELFPEWRLKKGNDN